MNLEFLEELVAFKKYGTLSATAEHLMITQPSVTRGMKKIEQEIGVPLFNREKNRISLNDTGKLAAKKAEAVLAAESDMIETVLNYHKQQHQIPIGSIAPGPLWWLDSIKDHFNDDITIDRQPINEDNVLKDLRSYKEKIIYTSQEIETDDVESMFFGSEHLYVKIDKFNPLSQKKSLTFNDLAGLSFLVVQDIGPWSELIRKCIPNAKFLYQENLNSLDELTKYSTFPVFRTNFTMAGSFHDRDDDDRILIPIDDPNNSIDFYGTYLKEQRNTVQPVLKLIAQLWSKKQKDI